MAENKFTDWDKIILVVGGCDKDQEARKLDIQNLFPEAPQLNLSVIETAFDNWEYTGYHMLYVHRESPLVKSDKYLFLMDTCTVGPRFPGVIKELENFVPKRAKQRWIHGQRGRKTSNIYLFSREVVLAYKDNFGVKVNKGQAVQLEGVKTLTVRGRRIGGIRAFGDMYPAARGRVSRGFKDVYKTGYPRKGYWYPRFALTKWIFWCNSGDITGKLLRRKRRKKRKK